MGADVEGLEAERLELLHQPFLQLEAGVVRPDGNDFGHCTLMYKNPENG